MFSPEEKIAIIDDLRLFERYLRLGIVEGMNHEEAVQELARRLDVDPSIIEDFIRKFIEKAAKIRSIEPFPIRCVSPFVTVDSLPIGVRDKHL
ncbi:hypothetical protein KJA15_01540 [Patescibacteria group bacterium]|nr:hypothetical protein [Patescibacteria group bacterium]